MPCHIPDIADQKECLSSVTLRSFSSAIQPEGNTQKAGVFPVKVLTIICMGLSLKTGRGLGFLRAALSDCVSDEKSGSEDHEPEAWRE